MSPAIGQLYADFSFSKPSIGQLRSAGYSGVIGYLSTPDNTSGSGKNISAAQVANYQQAGFDVPLVWETSAQRALNGAPAGQVDGALAFAQARGRGLPLTTPLFFNVGDFAASPLQIPSIAAYLGAAVAQCPGQLCGAYGTGYIIDQLAPSFPHVVWWQNAEDDQGDKGSNISPNAHLYQRVSPTHPIPGTDEDVVCRVWAAAPPPAPPSVLPNQGDETLITSQVIGNTIHVWGVLNEVGYHWWQTVGGNQPVGGVTQPNWYGEKLPTP